MYSFIMNFKVLFTSSSHIKSTTDTDLGVQTINVKQIYSCTIQFITINLILPVETPAFLHIYCYHN